MLNRNDLNKIQGLMNYINTGFNPISGGHDLVLEQINVVDSNGEVVAVVFYEGDEYHVKTP